MILVCGEALIDLFVGAAEGAEMPARAVAGGSPFNVAIGHARLGVIAGFLGGISRDRFGALLADILVREGVDDRFLVRTDRLSTISLWSRPTTMASRAMLFTARARRTVRSRSPICRLSCRRASQRKGVMRPHRVRRGISYRAPHAAVQH
jgi:sugar/nucleoside kinase (ribokinase family)